MINGDISRCSSNQWGPLRGHSTKTIVLLAWLISLWLGRTEFLASRWPGLQIEPMEDGKRMCDLHISTLRDLLLVEQCHKPPIWIDGLYMFIPYKRWTWGWCPIAFPTLPHWSPSLGDVNMWWCHKVTSVWKQTASDLWLWTLGSLKDFPSQLRNLRLSWLTPSNFLYLRNTSRVWGS